MNDPLLELIARLPPSEIRKDRAERTQARCHRVLARRSKLRANAVRPAGITHALVGLAALYFIETVREVFHLYGVR